jgi:tetratricopeptide (TPR) repeat protein
MFLLRALGNFGSIGGPLSWVMVGVGVVAIGLLVWYLVRRWGAEAPTLHFGEGHTQHNKSTCDDGVIALIDQALAHNPHSLEALKARGIWYSQMGEYNLAMQDFHMWVLRAPESGDAYFHRGNIWQKLDLIGLAISDYRYALKFNPSHETARSALAELMRDSTVNRPKTIFSLAALFAGDGPAPDSKLSIPEPRLSAGESTADLHG